MYSPDTECKYMNAQSQHSSCCILRYMLNKAHRYVNWTQDENALAI